MRKFCMCYIVCSGGVTAAMTTVYLHTLHDLHIYILYTICISTYSTQSVYLHTLHDLYIYILYTICISTYSTQSVYLRTLHDLYIYVLYTICISTYSTQSVYLRTLHDLIPTELLERGLKCSMIVRNVTLVKQRVAQALVIHEA
jgi:hypothetical protein